LALFLLMLTPQAVAAMGALAAATGIAVWGQTPAGKQATQQAAQGLANAVSRARTAVRDAVTDDTCEDCDPCRERNSEINRSVNELKKRHGDMLADKMDLFNTRPTGPMSWQGHIDQFKQKQKNLRRQLNDAASQGCTPPGDAWSWASRQSPSRPNPK
jgi:hypothetical protein